MSDDVPTQLVDLTGVPLAALRADWDGLEADREAVLAQVERPRVNLGTGPPGRAD